jgi:hypothetical protein
MADEVFEVEYKVDTSGVEADSRAAGALAKSGFEQGWGSVEVKPKIGADKEGVAKSAAESAKVFQEAAAKAMRDAHGRFATEAAESIKPAAEQTRKHAEGVGEGFTKAGEVGVASLGALKTALTGLTEFMATGSFAAAARGLSEFTESAARTGEATGGIGATLAKAAPYITAFIGATGAAAVGTKELADRGSEAVLSFDAIAKSSTLGRGAILGMGTLAKEQGLGLEDLARGLARFNLSQIRARRQIEQRAVEEPLDTADAQERVLKSYRDQAAALDAVGAAQDRVTEVRGALAAQQVGGVEEQAIATARGPLAIQAAGLAGAGAAISRGQAGLNIESAQWALEQFQTGRRPSQLEVREHTEAQLEENLAAAQQQARTANLAEQQAALQLREAENQQRQREQRLGAVGGEGGAAQLETNKLMRELSQSLRGVVEAGAGVGAARRATTRVEGALERLPFEQITGVAEMIRRRDPGLSTVDPAVVQQALQLIGQGPGYGGPGQRGALGALQDFLKAGEGNANLTSAGSAVLGQIFGTRGPGVETWRRILETSPERLSEALGHEPTPEERARYSPQNLQRAIGGEAAAQRFQSQVTADAIASMSKTVPAVAKGFEVMADSLHGVLTGLGIVPTKPAVAPEEGPTEAPPEGGAPRRRRAAPAGEAPTGEEAPTDQGGEAPTDGGGLGFVGEHPWLTALGGLLGLKTVTGAAGAVGRAGGGLLLRGLFGLGAAGAGAVEGGEVGAAGGAAFGGVGAIPGAAIGAVAGLIAGLIAPKLFGSGAAPTPGEQPTPEGVTPVDKLPSPGQAPEGGAGGLQGAAGALQGAAGALQGAAGALQGAAESLSSAGAAAPPAQAPAAAATGGGGDRGALTATEQARGGLIMGSGDATSDTIPAWLSPHEYVIRAATVQRLGVGFLDRLNSGSFASGGLVRAATEAGVSRSAAEMATMSDEDLQTEINRARITSIPIWLLSEFARGTKMDVQTILRGGATLDRWTLAGLSGAGGLIGRAWHNWLAETMKEAPHAFAVPPPKEAAPREREAGPVPTDTGIRAALDAIYRRSRARAPAAPTAEVLAGPIGQERPFAVPREGPAPTAPKMAKVEVERHGEEAPAPESVAVPAYTPEIEAREKARGFTLVGGPDIDLTKHEKFRFADIDLRSDEDKAVERSGRTWQDLQDVRIAARRQPQPDQRIARLARQQERRGQDRERFPDLVGDGGTRAAPTRRRRRRGDEDEPSPHFAMGGLVPALVSNGEYLMSGGAVASYGVDFMHALNAGRLQEGGFPFMGVESASVTLSGSNLAQQRAIQNASMFGAARARAQQFSFSDLGVPQSERFALRLALARGDVSQQNAIQDAIVFGAARPGSNYAQQFSFGNMGLTQGLAPPLPSGIPPGGGAISQHTLDLITSGGSFPVSAAADTIEAIRASAIGSRLTSTGVRPSWY